MFKRIVYIAFIILLCVFVSPIILIIGFCVCISSGFPIFYSQKRTGKNGKTFVMYKFRTMNVHAEKQQASLLSQNEANGPVFKIRNDPRFTPIGKYLSHMGFDELPQLINVLKGEMSLIGPRPLPLSESVKLVAWQKKRLAINPGIISPWVLDGYHKKTFTEWMKSDIQYVNEKSMTKDAELFVRSIWYLCGLVFFSRK